MEAPDNSEQMRRMPLAEAVADCVKRWFTDTLREAKAGDTSMQVLVAQMYNNGYGIRRDGHKVEELGLAGLQGDDHLYGK
ncbi:UNVERIFIED_CONTAM: hypothetical protein Sradi_1937200 [Sesamum radiatum]|uniref:Uncharacterized protein n=1 Tax=Sesamum radiatum TaxID=300843 RepID=A0AAW2TEM6_SESRA